MLRGFVLFAALLLYALGVSAQTPPMPAERSDGIWVNSKLFQGYGEPLRPPAAPPVVTPPVAASPPPSVRAPSSGPTIALASAVGGQMNLVAARYAIGSNRDPNFRASTPVSGNVLDAIVLRGLDRVVSSRVPDSERVFLRLNSHVLEGVEPERRGPEALKRLLQELESWPKRETWDRIIIAVPHFQTFGHRGMASKLQGAGLYVHDIAGSLHDVIEPDGTPGYARQSSFLALYLYIRLVVVDAKSMEQLDSQVWALDEKMHDTSTDVLRMGRAIPPEVLAKRLEVFVESASADALDRTLLGRVEPGDIRQVPMPAQPAAR